LIGGPRVVFLDEPSAGMDPMARRGMFDVIDHISQQCAVVLTTHHLEEVEALADRVAIMVAGTLHCIGDKTHLKTKFGSGFELIATLEHPRFAPVFERFIQERIPNAYLNEKRGIKYTYALPADTKLSRSFAVIEDSRHDIGVKDYAISQTSLEQVFLRISEAEILREMEGNHEASPRIEN
jgi:ATP-binding cassette subfamily A (ABC1) protein 3